VATLKVNGQLHTIPVGHTGFPLLWILRDDCGLTGTKYGCGIDECGACTVISDGEAHHACNMQLGDIGSDTVLTTIEGLSPDGSHPVQRAWVAAQVPQCGYCQSGMIMAAVALLSRKPHPTDTDIDAAINNICVCGTYQRIRAAIHLAAGD
jgi:isoquinoline 1-oxidoreductase alpha subunit